MITNFKIFEGSLKIGWEITLPNIYPKVGDHLFVKPGHFENRLCKIVNVTPANMYVVKFIDDDNIATFTRDELIPFKSKYEEELYINTIKYNL